MSENIQSISQGTYTIGSTSVKDSSLLVTQNEGDVSILQTPQEVSHDNTLSGNGTVDSPLGVVNGYNETVLWSGGLTSTLSLSEPMSEFNRVRFVMYCDNTTAQQNQNLIHEIEWNNGNLVTMADTVRYPATATFPIYEYRWGANIASNGKDISNVYHEMYWHPKDSWSGGGLIENAAYYPVKIIGINRKQ